MGDAEHRLDDHAGENSRSSITEFFNIATAELDIVRLLVAEANLGRVDDYHFARSPY
jgi:hypothetical protein